MSMLIQHSMAAWNAERQFNIVTKSKAKKTEKLSSGYRINRAADDAAGLSISEKMRRQIRGLEVGTENAEMGISWVQIGEGALNEAHDIMHRMNELSIQAQNGTWTATDRAYMEAEFEQLQGELDRISTTTTFNELNIFEEHEPVYDQICGNIEWDYEEYHYVRDGRNRLTIAYRQEAASDAEVISITVPPGKYTTHELLDEIDDAFGVDSPIHMEFTEKGFCKLNLEGGEVMDSVSGGLTYLLWDNYGGGGYGTLIGTTEFVKNDDGTDGTLAIVRGQNDAMWVEVESFDPSVKAKSGWIYLLDQTAPEGTVRDMTKQEIMDRINAQIAASSELSGTGLKASDHGLSIQLGSEDGIVTGFKGNMFKIEKQIKEDDPIYTSAFYDNIQYGYVKQDPASVVGGAVLTTDVRDEEHNRYYIDSSNNTLVLNPNPITNSVKDPITITIPQKAANAADPTKEGYTAQEMVDALNEIFEKTAGLKGEVKAYLVRSSAKVREEYPDGKKPGGAAETKESVGDDSLVFEGIEIRTVKEGPDAIVNIDKNASTAYDTLFTTKSYNKYGTGEDWDAKVDNETTADKNAYSLGKSEISSSIRFTSANNKFELTLTSTSNRNTTSSNDVTKTFTINVGTGKKSLEGIKDAINNDLTKHKLVVGKDKDGNNIEVSLDKLIKAETDGKCIKIVDNEDLTLDNAEYTYPNWNTEIDVGASGSNAGYRILFQEKEEYEENKTYAFKGSAPLTVPSGGMTGPITFYVNGVEHTIGGAGMTAQQAKDDYYQETPIRFATVESKSETKPQSCNVEGDGTTEYTYWAGGSAKGQAKPYQGSTRWQMNTPATLEVGPAVIPSSVVVDDSNDQITLGLNGTEHTFTLAHGTFNQDQLADALQDAIDKKAGDGFGGAIVEIKGNQFVITSRLGKASTENGGKTSITSYAQGQRTNTFFDSLVRSETAASCTTTLNVKSGISMTGLNNDDVFEFTFTDKKGISHNVTLDLVQDGDTDPAPTNIGSLVSRIQKRLQEEGLDGKVKVEKSGSKLKLSTIEKGEKTHIEYTTGPSGHATANAKAIFGDLDTGVTTPQAKITLNKNAKKNVSFTGTKTFKVRINNNWETIEIEDGWGSYSALESKLNNGLNGNDGLLSYGVKADVSSSGTITLTNQLGPGDGSLRMEYDRGGSVMEDMFGTIPASTADDVTLSVSGNKITIKAVKADGSADTNAVINIDSKDSGGTLKGKPAVRYWDHTRVAGFHSAKFSTVTSVDLSDYVKAGGIELNRWNNELEFEFTENGTAAKADQKWKPVSFRLTESGAGNKTSIADMVKDLQAKLDAALGADKVEAVFDTNTNKLSLKSVKPGAQFQFRGMVSSASGGNTNLDATNKIGGGFYHHVMCRSEEQKSQLADPTDINGDQFPDDIFAQGRHDLIFDPAGLHPGISDTLILDLNYAADANHDGTVDDGEMKDVKTIKLTLHLKDTEPYFENYTSSGEVLKKVRDALKEAINSQETQDRAKELGIVLHDNLIEADIGRHDTQVIGNKDAVSMSFTITHNPDIATPVEGYFYIDGIRGNAAYETFYYTEGELIPAYIEGTKDISGGVVLGEHDNELVLLVDGEIKKVDLSKLEKGKTISAAEIINTITEQFKDQGLPLAVALGKKGNLRISFDRMGNHTIEQVTGSAREELFFEEHAAKRPSREREIRISSFEGDRLSVYSPRFSTTMLGINSCCISTVKYAEKATNRLKEAIKKVADMRSTFGAIQNRFEHTVNNNLNKHENLQAAESRIRDADISDEMVEFSNLNIIQQAGQAVLAQANQSRNAMLSLLS